MLKKSDLLAMCLTQTSVFKSSLGEIKLRQLTIAESEEVLKIQQNSEKTMKDVIFHTLKCAMVEPEFFTEEELNMLGKKGQEFIYEVFNEVPMIGMTDEEKEDYSKKVEEFLSKKDDSEKEETNTKKK